MASIYIIKNEDKKTAVEINDSLIGATIKSIKPRSPKLYLRWIDVLEELEGIDYDEKRYL